MSVVILKWNPAFSSYTMARFLNDLEKCALSNDGDAGMNWSIWDHALVHEGDICYMLKVGYGQVGIVARGVITSEPYSGEDWAWRNRPTKYCDFTYGAMINPDAFPLLDSNRLSQAIPGFDWQGGHSGVVLDDEQARALESLWAGYMRQQEEYFKNASDQNLFIAAEPVEDDGFPYSMELDKGYHGASVSIESKEGDINMKLTIYNYHRVLGKFGAKSWRMLQRLFRQAYPTASSLQTLCADLFRNQIEFNADFYKQSDEEDGEDD